MADEEKEIEEIADSVPKPDEYPEGQAEELEESLNDEGQEANEFEEAVVDIVAASEEATDAAPVRAFDKAISAIQRGIQSVGDSESDPHEHNTDVTVFMGKTYDMPLYTSIFLVLGVLTLIEVVVAEIITADIISIPINLGLAFTKAGLVVYYYMHLNTDSKVFALTLIVPVVVALLSVLFLFGIPTGY